MSYPNLITQPAAQWLQDLMQLMADEQAEAQYTDNA